MPVMCELDVFSIIKTTAHWCWQECASQVGLSRSFSSSFWHSLWRCWSISIEPSILRASFGDWQHMSIGFIDGLNLSGELVRLAASGLSQPRGWVITSARCPVWFLSHSREHSSCFWIEKRQPAGFEKLCTDVSRIWESHPRFFACCFYKNSWCMLMLMKYIIIAFPAARSWIQRFIPSQESRTWTRCMTTSKRRRDLELLNDEWSFFMVFTNVCYRKRMQPLREKLWSTADSVGCNLSKRQAARCSFQRFTRIPLTSN